jgi:transcriptional regulator with XRE-family HTH domain
VVDEFNLALGQRLRAARRRRGWSLGEVETNTQGEFKASVSGAYERGERAISVQRFVRLAEMYAVSAGELLPAAASDGFVIDLDALSDEPVEIVDMYLAAIQLLRRETGDAEVRQSDRAIIGSLMQSRRSVPVD